MSNYPTASAQDDLDVLTAMYLLLDTVLGSGSETNTASKGAVAVWDRITAALESTRDYGLVALATAAKTLREKTKTASGEAGYGNTAADLLKTYLMALNTELGAGNTPATLNGWLTEEEVQVHPTFATLYAEAGLGTISPANIFPLVTSLGYVLRSGGTFTFTDGSAILPTASNGAACEVYVWGGVTIGAANCVLTLTMKKFDGSTEQKVVTVTSGALAGATFDIGTADDVYIDCTACTVTGGTDGDKIGIRTKLLRDVTAAIA